MAHGDLQDFTTEYKSRQISRAVNNINAAATTILVVLLLLLLLVLLSTPVYSVCLYSLLLGQPTRT